MAALSLLPHLRVETSYEREDVGSSLWVEADPVLAEIFFKLRLLHISIPIGIHFTEHFLNLMPLLCGDFAL